MSIILVPAKAGEGQETFPTIRNRTLRTQAKACGYHLGILGQRVESWIFFFKSEVKCRKSVFRKKRLY